MKKIIRLELSWVLLVITLTVGLGLVLEAHAYDRKSNRENRVRVDVVPVQLVSGKPAQFEVRMNTHSGDIGQDMVSVCALKDDNDREYQPVSWDGSPPGGHHRSGILEFPSIDGNTESVTLVIRNIANVPERIFTWKLE